ncbi:MAG: TonB-dependent receptor [Bacteroides sp.]|uniref:TonB-dependent receptor n=3 Tax=Bacteroides sp. TaxID=29523 RepID=UPI002FC7E9BA
MDKHGIEGFLRRQKSLNRSFLIILFISLFSYTSLELSAVNSVFEQHYILNISFKAAKLERVLDAISQQSGIRLAYSNEELAVKSMVSVNIKTSNIQEALRAVLGDGYTFKQIDNYIAIAKKTNEGNSKLAGVQQKKGYQIKGLITDADGNPIIGATVSVKGSTTGVITDIDGRYIIEAAEGATIVFRYIGYNTEEKVVKKETTINVRMMESSVGLDDVVVIAYGQQKKSSVVSSMNTISSKEIAMPSRNLTNNLAGQIAGVIAIQRSGEPGRDDSQFWIRGVSSFAGGVSPLVLVDGVPRRMNDIGVDEIESFTVLKDAAATAVYGAEGANGVVLITSKRGETSKLKIDVRAEFTNSTPTRLSGILSSYDHLSLYNDASWEDAGNPTSFQKPYSDDILEKYRTGVDPDLYPNADFLSLLKDNTQNGRAVINLRGGSDRVRYFTSASFYKENGIFKSSATENYNANIGLERYNLRSNIDIDLTKKTLLSVDMSGQYMNIKNPGTSTDKIFTNIYYYAPYLFPLRFSDGRFSDDTESNNDNRNPYNFLNETGYTRKWDVAIQSKVALKQQLDFLTDGLDLRLAVSFDADLESSMARTKSPQTFYIILENGEKKFVQKDAGQPDLTDFKDFKQSSQKKIFMEASVNYKRTFGDKHDVTGLLLYMQKETHSTGLPYRKQSVVARASYGFDNRYMLEGSFGLTGSENFAKGYRYGIFPAIGVAWYLSNESFMKPVQHVINKLKLRASFGKTGNDNIGANNRFPYRGTLKTDAPGFNLGFSPGAGGGGNNSFGGGIVEDVFESPLLSWEIEKKKNIGIDLGLFNGRVDLMVDAFSNRRTNILMQRKVVSNITGFNKAPWQNYGIVTNKGIDANIVLKQTIGKTNFSIRGNLTYATNEIIEYDEVNPPHEYMRYTGNSLNTPILYVAEGLYSMDDFDIVTDKATGAKEYTLKSGLPVPSASVKPGDIKYKDLNGDGDINTDDRTYKHGFATPEPELVYGFGLNVEHKGFYAGIFFQGVGNTAMNLLGSRSFIPFGFDMKTSIRTEGLNHWSTRNPDNMDVMYPRLHATTFTHNQLPSTYWYRDASFIRLKNLEFGYQFNKRQMKKVGLSNLRIYIQGNNLAVWDDIKMWDPELGSAGAGAKYPISSTWTAGLEIGF